MKKLVMLALVVAGLGFSASAQQKEFRKGGHHGRKHHRMDMAKQLNFSEDQKKQAATYKQDLRSKMQELNKQENITVKEQRDRRNAIMKEHKAKMDGLLTAEQKTKMAQLKKEGKEKREQHYAKHLDRMKTQLGLSDAQVTRMKAQRETVAAKRKAIMDNASLSREQKKTQMIALKNESKEERKKIFTPEQLKKMEELKKNRPERNKAVK